MVVAVLQLQDGVNVSGYSTGLRYSMQKEKAVLSPSLVTSSTLLALLVLVCCPFVSAFFQATICPNFPCAFLSFFSLTLRQRTIGLFRPIPPLLFNTSTPHSSVHHPPPSLVLTLLLFRDNDHGPGPLHTSLSLNNCIGRAKKGNERVGRWLLVAALSRCA